MQALSYDVVLGALGVLTALSAWKDFKHEGVRNEASGTLAKEATVTSAEMLEHVFYQVLNLVHVVFLHLLGPFAEALPPRLLLLCLVTAPWLLRKRFPVNPFSANYTKQAAPGGTVVKTLYRVKKMQYLLYKHCLLHGLNVSVAINGGPALPESRPFRTYWWCLSAAYVMEFFLQTLVKRGYMRQRVMLLMQGLLMFASTVAATRVALLHVRPVAALSSLALNLLRRGHELQNTAATLALAGLASRYSVF